jgi:hypothetical protein
LALPGINDRIVDQTMSLSTSSLAFEKYTGGTAQMTILGQLEPFQMPPDRADKERKKKKKK